MILTAEDELYIPLSIDYLLRRFKSEVVEVVCARNHLIKSKYVAAKIFSKAFGVFSVLAQGLRVAGAKIFDNLDAVNFTGRRYSVRKVCRLYNVNYLFVDNVNASDFLSHCRDLKPDLIVAVSPSQIFKGALIGIPAFGSINIHTAKLPKYRGLYPTFWAMSEGEKELGISIHYIEKGIDTGKIILQDSLEIPAATTLDHMLTISKLRGAELLADAINQIRDGKVNAFCQDGPGSYYSFPTRQAYIKFKKNGFKLF